MKLLVLFLQYDLQKYPNSFQNFKRYIDLLDCKKNIIIIDNLSENRIEEKIAWNIYFIGGDNSSWEFSGWDKGVAFAKQKKLNFDVVLFANDSFFSYGWSILENCARYKLPDIAYRKKAIVGQLDTKNFLMNAFGYDVSTWICTNTFFIHKEILEKVVPLAHLSDTDLDMIVSKSFDKKKFLCNNILSTSYKEMLLQWLTKDWHSKMVISEENFDFFRKKVTAMINESLLTARIRSLGYEVLSYSEIQNNYNSRKVKKNLRSFFGKLTQWYHSVSSGCGA